MEESVRAATVKCHCSRNSSGRGTARLYTSFEGSCVISNPFPLASVEGHR